MGETTCMPFERPPSRQPVSSIALFSTSRTSYGAGRTRFNRLNPQPSSFLRFLRWGQRPRECGQSRSETRGDQSHVHRAHAWRPGHGHPPEPLGIGREILSTNTSSSIPHRIEVIPHGAPKSVKLIGMIVGRTMCCPVNPCFSALAATDLPSALRRPMLTGCSADSLRSAGGSP